MPHASGYVSTPVHLQARISTPKGKDHTMRIAAHEPYAVDGVALLVAHAWDGHAAMPLHAPPAAHVTAMRKIRMALLALEQ